MSTQSATAAEHAKFLIGRYDHYFESSNTKGSFYLAFDTLFATIIVATTPFAMDKLSDGTTKTLFLILLTAIFLFLVTSIFYTLEAINPFLRNANKPASTTTPKYHSLIFFGSVAALTQKDFMTQVLAQPIAEQEADLLIQAHELAQGLTRKYDNLSIAALWIRVVVLLLIPLFALLIANQI